MKVGVLGSGEVARTLASGLLKHGYEVKLGSRSPEKLAEWAEANAGGSTGTFADAASFGELVIVAVKGNAAAEALRLAGAGNLKGKAVADTCNPIADAAPVNGVLQFFTGPNESLLEQLQSEFKDAHLVKAFNSVGSARMVDPVWPGCISAGDPQSRQWLLEHKVPLFAWSSQARGFFTDRAGPDRRSDGELVRSWYADDNFRRRDRAIALAAELGVSPINLALANVLCQPFPAWALVGPREISETVSTLGAFKVNLTPAQLSWLNLGSD